MRLNEFLNNTYRNQPYCVLFGHPVDHSLSPLMHQIAADYHDLDITYYALDVAQYELQSVLPLFNDDTFVGANVTIPYKNEFSGIVDQLDERVKKIGALNTITRSGRDLIGRNTDVDGFLHPLEDYRDDLEDEYAVVFGTGGAASGVCYGLLEDINMAQVTVISRDPVEQKKPLADERVKIESYANWTAFADEATLVVNTTPVGMHPNVNARLFPSSEVEILADKICYDLVYKPRETTFLQDAEDFNAAEIIGGLDMLIYQGSKAFEHWTGKTFPIKKIKQRLIDELGE